MQFSLCSAVLCSVVFSTACRLQQVCFLRILILHSITSVSKYLNALGISSASLIVVFASSRPLAVGLYLLPLAGRLAHSVLPVLCLCVFALSPCAACRPSRRPLLSLSGALPQGDAPPHRPLRQNQRRVGDPTGVAAADQASWEWAVWGGLDGYGSARLRHRVEKPD